MLVRPIDTLLPRSSRNFGGKARNLAALVRAGFPVPAAFAVNGDAAVQTFARVLPRELLPAQIFADPNVPESKLREARELVLGADLAPGLVSELRRAFDALRGAGAIGIAVRSSSTGEDLSAASAAGLLTSVLNVRDSAAMLDAVRSCYASVFSPQVATYVQNLGVDAVATIGVVIQAMVPADVAGVLFTVNPLTGDADEMVIDAAYGLGTSVTSGRVTPDTYRIEKRSGWVRDRVTGDKRLRVVAASGGGLREEPVRPALALKQALDEHMLAQLVALGGRIEEHFGDARDVEFAIAADSIYVLQARAVTALVPSAPRPRGRRKRRLATDASTVVWSNLNVGEALPGVATPLTWSILSEFSDLGFRNAFAALGCKVPKDAKLVGNFRGRIYLNLSELTAIAAQVPGLKPSLVLPLGGGGEVERLEREQPRPASGGFFLRLPATAVRFTHANLGFDRRVSAFESAFEAERLRVERMDLRILPASALDETLSDVHRLLDEAGVMLLTAYGGLLSALLPLRVALAALRGADASRIQHTLLSAISDVESAGPGREILRVAAAFERDAAARERLLGLPLPASVDELPDGEARRAVQAFLRQYGHRGVREAEVGEPRWRENPRLLFDALRVHVEHGTAESELRMERRVAAVKVAAESAVAGLPLPVRPPLRVLLAVVRNYVRVRERLRSQVVHVLGLFRVVALDASRRLAVREPDIGPDAAFFLTLSELHGALRGEIRSVTSLVRMRRAQFDRDRSLPEPPDTFVGYPPPIMPEPETGVCLQGLGASSGAVEGAVRVLRSTDDVASLVPGEILVVVCADVGWSPVFPVAGGLVTDLGGPLSHACVVAREYGLPAVVNVRTATRALKTGDRVRVDGDSGTVQRLSP